MTVAAPSSSGHCQVNGGRRQSTDGITVSTAPLSTRNHRPCRLAVPSVSLSAFAMSRTFSAERGITVSYEAIRSWCRKFGPAYARTLRRRQGRLGDIWHVDELFVTIRGQRHYLWRAGGPVWRCPRYPGQAPPREESRQTLLSQGLETPGEATVAAHYRQAAKLSGCAPRGLPISSPTEPVNTRTTGPKSPTSTPGSRNARCVDSNQRLRPNDFSRSTVRFTTCSELHVII